MSTPDENHTEASPVNLEQIMLRGDTWRGEFPSAIGSSGFDTGFPALNDALVTGGWPARGLIEVSQLGLSHQEWQLLAPTLRRTDGMIVLLNPPLIPFAHGLINASIDIERVRVVRSSRAEDFISRGSREVPPNVA